jgi:hypothetical protein
MASGVRRYLLSTVQAPLEFARLESLAIQDSRPPVGAT